MWVVLGQTEAWLRRGGRGGCGSFVRWATASRGGVRCSTCGGLLVNSEYVFQVKPDEGLQSGTVYIRQVVKGRLRGVLVPHERGTAGPFSDRGEKICYTIFSLDEGGDLIGANCLLAFNQSIIIRSSSRCARCTQNGSRQIIFRGNIPRCTMEVVYASVLRNSELCRVYPCMTGCTPRTTCPQKT